MIFLGCLFDRKNEAEYLKKSRLGLSNAANTFQWNLIEGLKANGEKVTVINALPVGTFPRCYRQLVLQDRVWEHDGEANYEVGCVNIPFIKQFQRYRRVKKLLKNTTDTDIIIYSAYEPFLRAAYKLDSRYTVTAVITDLPAYYDLGKTSSIWRLLRKWNNKKVEKYLSRVDKFVLLTEQMREPLKVGDKPYTVVEGICSGEASVSPEFDEDEKRILYTGTLHRRYGIMSLLEAFSMIEDDSYRLWICGGGDSRDEVIAAAEADPRITFYGYVTKEQVGELQQQATVMINPRANTEEFTKYSFPSKTMEYMLSGKPVVMYKLDGIPDEYDRYLYYIEGNSPAAIKEAILSVCNMTADERREFGAAASRFVAENKNSKRQGKRIIELISE